jgi:hypothetical protein
MTTTNNAPISFRLTDEEMELLKQYQEDGEKSLNLTAKRLLLSALGVDVKKSSLQLVNTVDINQVKELVDLAVQEKITELTKVDSVDNLKRHEVDQLINDRIKVGLEDGGDINSFVYKLVDNVNNSVNHVYSELQELKAAIPPVPVKSPQSPPGEDVEAGVSSQEAGEDNNPMPNTQLPGGDGEDCDRPIVELSPIPNQLPMTEDQEKIIDLLGIREILYSPISPGLITAKGIGEKIKDNKASIEAILGSSVDMKCGHARKLGNILKAAGFDVGGNEKQGYFVKNRE